MNERFINRFCFLCHRRRRCRHPRRGQCAGSPEEVQRTFGGEWRQAERRCQEVLEEITKLEWLHTTYMYFIIMCDRFHDVTTIKTDNKHLQLTRKRKVSPLSVQSELFGSQQICSFKQESYPLGFFKSVLWSQPTNIYLCLPLFAVQRAKEWSDSKFLIAIVNKNMW